ncbi:MAG: GrpB family protein [Clostridiales bacterium]|jgi:GrpB-like predicted nucleotidyltransferase (UPF0157 family)/8-oxo-dGTP pyrophosphatase MutT (NUDIX family)|nr:GrpB family protein [Clostridiales bacterium]
MPCRTEFFENNFESEPEIEIEKHSSLSLKWFQEEKDVLSSLIGAENIERIRHIGSTSIQGMPGRPIVDILVELRLNADEKQTRAKIGSRYRLIGVDGEGTRWIYQKRFIVYLNKSISWNCEAFRHYLLKHPETANLYTDLRKGLQERYRLEPAKYHDGKLPFIEEVTQRAKLLSKAMALLGKTVTLSLSSEKLSGGSSLPAYPGLWPGDSQFGQCMAYAIGAEESSGPLMVTAVIERMDKWELAIAACPSKLDLTQQHIEEALSLNFPCNVSCCHEKSVGFIPFRRTQDGLEYLLALQSRPLAWSFPKGHMDAHETELETARREAIEEIGVELAPIPGFRTEIEYSIGIGRYKTVVLFLSEVKEVNIAYGDSEISEHCFAKKDRAVELLRNAEYLRVITEAEEFLANFKQG